jgi:hypothetical protein
LEWLVNKRLNPQTKKLINEDLKFDLSFGRDPKETFCLKMEITLTVTHKKVKGDPENFEIFLYQQ